MYALLLALFAKLLFRRIPCAGRPPISPWPSLVNILLFAILLAAFLFGGHSALHWGRVLMARRALLRRACHAPEHQERAWVGSLEDGRPHKLWLQFTGEPPQTVAQGSTGGAKAVTRLSAAGITVESGATQQKKDAGIDGGARWLPGQHRSREISDFSPMARARLFRWRAQSMVRRAAAFARRLKQAV